MNALRRAFSRACVLSAHELQPHQFKLGHLYNRTIFATDVNHAVHRSSFRGLATESSTQQAIVRQERKTVQLIWNKELDERLVAGVKQFTTKDWKSVANYMGREFSVVQCKRRWYMHFQSQLDNEVVDREWTESEVSQLHEQVNNFMQTEQEKVKWTVIAKELNRTVAQVKFKWAQCQYKPMGTFTADEDAYIWQAVTSAEGQTRGIWPKIGVKLGRQASMVRARYLVLKSGARPSKVPWTGEMDPFLVAALGTEIKPDWTKVAAHMAEKGWKVTSAGCRSRWNSHIRHIHDGLRVDVEWTQTEMDALLQMRKKNMKWGSIAKILNIVPKLCKSKHATLLVTPLKRGPFTPEEDAIITAQTALWGDPKHKRGLWTELQKMLNRPSANIRHRWFYKLYHLELEKNETASI